LRKIKNNKNASFLKKLAKIKMRCYYLINKYKINTTKYEKIMISKNKIMQIKDNGGKILCIRWI
jgi:hypothetical protein